MCVLMLMMMCAGVTYICSFSDVSHESVDDDDVIIGLGCDRDCGGDDDGCCDGCVHDVVYGGVTDRDWDGVVHVFWCV